MMLSDRPTFACALAFPWHGRASTASRRPPTGKRPRGERQHHPFPPAGDRPQCLAAGARGTPRRGAGADPHQAGDDHRGVGILAYRDLSLPPPREIELSADRIAWRATSPLPVGGRLGIELYFHATFSNRSCSMPGSPFGRPRGRRRLRRPGRARRDDRGDERGFCPARFPRSAAPARRAAPRHHSKGDDVIEALPPWRRRSPICNRPPPAPPLRHPRRRGRSRGRGCRGNLVLGHAEGGARQARRGDRLGRRRRQILRGRAIATSRSATSWSRWNRQICRCRWRRMSATRSSRPIPTS